MRGRQTTIEVRTLHLNTICDTLDVCHFSSQPFISSLFFLPSRRNHCTRVGAQFCGCVRRSALVTADLKGKARLLELLFCEGQSWRLQSSRSPPSHPLVGGRRWRNKHRRTRSEMHFSVRRHLGHYSLGSLFFSLLLSFTLRASPRGFRNRKCLENIKSERNKGQCTHIQTRWCINCISVLTFIILFFYKGPNCLSFILLLLSLSVIPVFHGPQTVCI